MPLVPPGGAIVVGSPWSVPEPAGAASPVISTPDYVIVPIQLCLLKKSSAFHLLRLQETFSMIALALWLIGKI